MIIIRKDTVWGPGEAYLYDDVQVAAGATLTILPGAQIHGGGHSLEIFGRLNAKGAAEAPIYLDDVYTGFGDNSSLNDASIAVDFTHINKGSLNGYTTGWRGELVLTNSVVTNVYEEINIYAGHDTATKVAGNIFLDSSGIEINIFAAPTISSNIFDRYGSVLAPWGGRDQGLAIYSNGKNGDAVTLSHGNAFLDVGAKTLEVASQYGGIRSKNDYYGTANKSIVNEMIFDVNDDLSAGNEVILDNPVGTPPTNLNKEMFSFISIALPREIIVNARLLGTDNIDIIGNTLNNKLIGNAGNNTIDGGLGADTMIGGAGNDTYVVDNVRDVILENAGKGTDRVVASVSYTLANNVEMLTLTGAKAINATGNALANHLIGNDAANALDGRGGADTMEGGAGNDVYFVDHASDRVIEAVGEGRDTVVTTVSYRLAADQQIEILQTADANGTAALKLTGNAFGNKLVGNAGNNVLDGGAGIDEMRGGAGNDTYVVDHARDVVVEAVRGGTDTVLSFVSYALKAGQEIESLRLTSTAGSVNLTGNEFGQSLTGNVGANVLDGGLGADVLTGGKGADTFVFSTKLGADNVDRITDFTGADTIRLSKSIFSALAPGELKAGEFKDIAKAKVDADDHILYDSRDGSLFYDADGSGKAAAVKFAILDNKAAITHADFLIA